VADTIHSGILISISAKENTLALLMHAPRAQSITPELEDQRTNIQERPLGNQQSLHSFWSLQKNNSSLAKHISAPERAFVPACEDCDLELPTNIAATLNGFGRQESLEFGCTACGRIVCDNCATLRAARVCLQCATGTGKTWVGGIGWM
jgi:hypothetical protein